MADLVVVVPSRGRPEAAATLIRVFDDTCTADTSLVFAVDSDDPTWDDYLRAVWQRDRRYARVVEAPSNMVLSLNEVVQWPLGWDAPPFAVAFMGDDHCPRTFGWDQAYVDALRELGTGIVYGDDLFQGRHLPTQVAMTSDIIRELGYMAPPTLTHLFVDNFWRDLGDRAECLRYLTAVVIEHRHPLAGKAEWDAGYARVNDHAMYARDQAAYAEYLQTRFDIDVAKVRALRGGA